MVMIWAVARAMDDGVVADRRVQAHEAVGVVQRRQPGAGTWHVMAEDGDGRE